MSNDPQKIYEETNQNNKIASDANILKLQGSKNRNWQFGLNSKAKVENVVTSACHVQSNNDHSNQLFHILLLAEGVALKMRIKKKREIRQTHHPQELNVTASLSFNSRKHRNNKTQFVGIQMEKSQIREKKSILELPENKNRKFSLVKRGALHRKKKVPKTGGKKRNLFLIIG